MRYSMCESITKQQLDGVNKGIYIGNQVADGARVEGDGHVIVCSLAHFLGIGEDARDMRAQLSGFHEVKVEPLNDAFVGLRRFTNGQKSCAGCIKGSVVRPVAMLSESRRLLCSVPRQALPSRA